MNYKKYSEEHRARVRRAYLAQYDNNPFGARRINFQDLLDADGSTEPVTDAVAASIDASAVADSILRDAAVQGLFSHDVELSAYDQKFLQGCLIKW